MSVLKRRIKDLEDKVEALEGTSPSTPDSSGDDTLDVKKVYNGLSDEVSELGDKIEKLGDDIEFLDGATKEHDNDIVSLREQISDLTHGQNAINEAIEEINEELEEHQRAIEAIDDAVDDLNSNSGSTSSTTSTTSTAKETEDTDEIPEV